MSFDKQIGGCFCSIIEFEMILPNSIQSYRPRECSCAFCQKHGAGYLSDNKGKLIINIKDANNLNMFRQGSELAEFLICKVCGILVAVCYNENNTTYATVNYRVLNNKGLLESSIKVSPEKLSSNEKIIRWKELWFNNVEINIKIV